MPAVRMQTTRLSREVRNKNVLMQYRVAPALGASLRDAFTGQCNSAIHPRARHYLHGVCARTTLPAVRIDRHPALGPMLGTQKVSLPGLPPHVQ
jgi:hypothetical protein